MLLIEIILLDERRKRVAFVLYFLKCVLYNFDVLKGIIYIRADDKKAFLLQNISLQYYALFLTQQSFYLCHPDLKAFALKQLINCGSSFNLQQTIGREACFCVEDRSFELVRMYITARGALPQVVTKGIVKYQRRHCHSNH